MVIPAPVLDAERERNDRLRRISTVIERMQRRNLFAGSPTDAAEELYERLAERDVIIATRAALAAFPLAEANASALFEFLARQAYRPCAMPACGQRVVEDVEVTVNGTAKTLALCRSHRGAIAG